MLESADFTIDDAVAPKKDDEKDMAAFIGMDNTAPMMNYYFLFLLSFLVFCVLYLF